MIAIVLVVAALGLVIALSQKGGDKGPDTTNAYEPEIPGPAPAPSNEPTEPRRPAPPPLPANMRAEAKRLVEQYEGDAKRAKKIYTEAMQAHKDGDDDLWQEKLAEASLIYQGILDGWNELIYSIETTDEWDDPDEIANHHIPRQQERIMRLLKLRKDIDKQRTLGGR